MTPTMSRWGSTALLPSFVRPAGGGLMLRGVLRPATAVGHMAKEDLDLFITNEAVPPYPVACLRGRPPLRPFSLAAAILASVRERPPFDPSCRAIQFLEPKTPCSNAGTYTSASSCGQCRPSPAGLISISAKLSGEALANPSASFVGKAN